MHKFKQLEWRSYGDKDLNGVYAEPSDLKWHYSIIVHAEDKVEFALLDSYCEYAPGFPQIYDSMDKAYEMANKHYLSLLNDYILN